MVLSERIAWQIERHFGRYGEISAVPEGQGGDRLLRTSYGIARMIVSWVLGLGENARLQGPEELVAEYARRVELLERWHAEGPPDADGGVDGAAGEAGADTAEGEGDVEGEGQGDTNGEGTDIKARRGARAATASANGGATRSVRRGGRRRRGDAEEEAHGAGSGEAAIRPERFARLVTLASILIQAGRAGERLSIAELRQRLQLSDEELREDIDVLNVVNFGGGSYVLYAEILEEEGEIEVDPEPYSDNFDRPARLLPVEGKALVAAIDLIGEHIPEGSLASAREKIVKALGEDPMEQGLQVAHATGNDSEVAGSISKAIVGHRLIELEYYKENEDEFSLRRVEPYALTNGREGWYVACFDPEREAMRHFRLDRIKRASVTKESFEPRPRGRPCS